MRVEGWESLLNEHIEQAGAFVWGQNDCALWTAEWVGKATGQDFADDWRGLYASEAELDDLLLARGISSPAELPIRAGLMAIPIGFVQRGDILLHPQGCLGVCNGLHGYFLTERGVTRLPTRNCVRAWEVR